MVLEDQINDKELEIQEIELDLAKWETEAQCDSVLIDANARMATILLRTKEIQLEIGRAELQLRIEMAQVQGLLNKAQRLSDDLEEAEQLNINLAVARTDPNVRIYRDDTIVNAEESFEDALVQAYRATKVLEYFTSQSYANLEELFLTRMVQYGEYNLNAYLVDLENAFFEFEELYGLPSLRVARISLRDDILDIPYTDTDGTAYSTTERIELMREVLADPSNLDEDGYLSIDFPTTLDELSPLTRVHKVDYVEAEIIGSEIGDTVGRLYLTQKGTSLIHALDDSYIYYRFDERTAVLNPYFNGNKVFDTGVYQSLHFKDRPFVNTNWSLVINQRDEQVNQDIDLQSLTDIRVYVYYQDFTEL